MWLKASVICDRSLPAVRLLNTGVSFDELFLRCSSGSNGSLASKNWATHHSMEGHYLPAYTLFVHSETEDLQHAEGSGEAAMRQPSWQTNQTRPAVWNLALHFHNTASIEMIVPQLFNGKMQLATANIHQLHACSWYTMDGRAVIFNSWYLLVYVMQN